MNNTPKSMNELLMKSSAVSHKMSEPLLLDRVRTYLEKNNRDLRCLRAEEMRHLDPKLNTDLNGHLEKMNRARHTYLRDHGFDYPTHDRVRNPRPTKKPGVTYKQPKSRYAGLSLETIVEDLKDNDCQLFEGVRVVSLGKRSLFWKIAREVDDSLNANLSENEDPIYSLNNYKIEALFLIYLTKSSAHLDNRDYTDMGASNFQSSRNSINTDLVDLALITPLPKENEIKRADLENEIQSFVSVNGNNNLLSSNMVEIDFERAKLLIQYSIQTEQPREEVIEELGYTYKKPDFVDRTFHLNKTLKILRNDSTTLFPGCRYVEFNKHHVGNNVWPKVNKELNSDNPPIFGLSKSCLETLRNIYYYQTESPKILRNIAGVKPSS